VILHRLRLQVEEELAEAEEGTDLPVRARVQLHRDPVSRTLQEEVVEEAIHPLADATVEEVQGTQSVLVLETFCNLG
jgi:hypothetical protein